MKLNEEMQKFVSTYAKRNKLDETTAVNKLMQIAKTRVNALGKYAARIAAGEVGKPAAPVKAAPKKAKRAKKAAKAPAAESAPASA